MAITATGKPASSIPLMKVMPTLSIHIEAFIVVICVLRCVRGGFIFVRSKWLIAKILPITLGFGALRPRS